MSTVRNITAAALVDRNSRLPDRRLHRPPRWRTGGHDSRRFDLRRDRWGHHRPGTGLRAEAAIAGARWLGRRHCLGLGLSLAVVTGFIGQIANSTEAAALGAVAGLVLGIGQAVVLRSSGVSNAWIWAPATAIAWAAGWFVTASAGIALDAGWPVFGLSGAIVSQVITGIVLWRLTASHPVVAATPA